MERIGADCVYELERLGKRADEEAISRALRDAVHGLLTRCQPVQRAYACVRVGLWLSSRAMLTLGECPCWEPVPPRTLSLLMFLVSHSLTFFLRAKAEAARAKFRWGHWEDPELCIQRLLPWALHESLSLGMPARFLRCMCECFPRTPNENLYKSEGGAKAHVILAKLIFEGQADVSIAAKIEVSHVELLKCAAGSSNIRVIDLDMRPSVCVNVTGVDGSSNTDGGKASAVNVTSGVVDVDWSSISKGVNVSSYVKDVDAQRKEDTASCAYSICKNALDILPHAEGIDTKRALELEECLSILQTAKELAPAGATLLKWQISLLRMRIELAAFSFSPKVYLHWMIKFPFASKSSGERDEEASNVFANMLGNQIAPCWRGKHWLYLAHIGITMSLLFYVETRTRR